MQEFNWRGWFSRRKEKIEVSVETQESWKINWLKKSRIAYCPACKTDTFFISMESAAQTINNEKRFVENLSADKKVHFRQRENEKTLVCLASLKKYQRIRSEN